MKRLEAQFGTKFKRWVHYMWPGKTFHFELKVARTDSLPFSAVSDKQKNNLRIAQNKFIHKYSDYDRMGTPFDGTFTKGAECYVVIQFDRPKNKEFFMCDINTFLDEEKISDRKSLTEARCKEICKSYSLA